MSNTTAACLPASELDSSAWAKALASLEKTLAEECGIRPLPPSLLDHTQKATHLDHNREIGH